MMKEQNASQKVSIILWLLLYGPLFDRSSVKTKWEWKWFLSDRSGTQCLLSKLLLRYSILYCSFLCSGTHEHRGEEEDGDDDEKQDGERQPHKTHAKARRRTAHGPDISICVRIQCISKRKQARQKAQVDNEVNRNKDVSLNRRTTKLETYTHEREPRTYTHTMPEYIYFQRCAWAMCCVLCAMCYVYTARPLVCVCSHVYVLCYL